MPASLEPIKKVPCTFKDCTASFDTEKEMRAHKKASDLHEFCSKCNEDFNSFEEFAMHKVGRPDKHDKACRICGDEFKTQSGLKRHIDLCHHVDQKIPCLGCSEQFPRASLLVQHLEYHHCPKITRDDFYGAVMHKTLVAELLKGGRNLDRFMQKIAKYDAAFDADENGGVNLLDQDDNAARRVNFPSIAPEIPQTAASSHENVEPYPTLSSQASTATTRSIDDQSDLAERLRGVSIGGTSVASVASSAVSNSLPLHSPSTGPSEKTEKPWTSGRSAALSLFPDAKPTPAPTEWSVENYEKKMEEDQGINILTTRFWDPASRDWVPERFYNPVTMKYSCPFVCECAYRTPSELQDHVKETHRIVAHKCPQCQKSFRDTCSLVAHCESRNMRCQINQAGDFGTFLDRITGGFLAVQEKIRPDHLHNPEVLFYNEAMGRFEKYRVPAIQYQQYSATEPVGWEEEKKKKTVAVGAGAGKSVMTERGGYFG